MTRSWAETRALNIFALAEVGHGVQVWSLANESLQDTIGRQDVQVFVTTLELRGTRDDILAVLRELPMTLQGNLLLGQVNVRGTSDTWNIRLSLRQIIQQQCAQQNQSLNTSRLLINRLIEQCEAHHPNQGFIDVIRIPDPVEGYST